MKIRRAKQSDFSEIAAIQAESWKDVYSDVLPAWFLAGQIDRDLARHWREVEIQKEDIVLVAEQGSLVGFAAAWCRPTPFIDNLHVRPSHRSKKNWIRGDILFKTGEYYLVFAFLDENGILKTDVCTATKEFKVDNFEAQIGVYLN